MNDPYHKIRLSIVSLTLVLVACAGTQNRNGASTNGSTNAPYEISEDYNTGVVRYTVQRGDRLGDIAQEFTGRISNWREIARHNDISNPSSLQEGQVVEIPIDLIPGYERPSTVTGNQAELAPKTARANLSTLALRKNVNEVEPVVVTPINTNRDFELNPIDPTAVSEQSSYTGAVTEVKVVGTYFPIGIYSEPAAYSKLMMRVAPGTQFVLISQVNDWYSIETSSGRGYIRTSDAAVVE